MQMYSLNIEDFSQDNYELIAIHTALEDFKLAYLLNNKINTQLRKGDYRLGFKNENNIASYSVYSYNNDKYGYEWYLIANSLAKEKTEQTGMLELTTKTKSYLIPEERNVDFFLKIVGDYKPEYIEQTIDRIKNIQQVVTSYSIDVNKLKSKEFLFF